MGIHPGLRRQLVAKQQESPDCRRSTIDGHTTALILLITVVVDNAFGARSAVQWHSFCQGPMTGTSPAGGINGLMSTYYYYVADHARYDRDCAAKFTGAQGGEADPTVGGHACTAKGRGVRHRSRGLSSGYPKSMSNSCRTRGALKVLCSTPIVWKSAAGGAGSSSCAKI
ncbi:uncharacterized protein [Triticum aestivum]|uniref:uncharacterized protein n=1 Tax=Triticum aestivum TaxID=4565 RepID=UPI001D014B77|nr:uncharacterized protein LOC123062611 [Triticum aestivum]